MIPTFLPLMRWRRGLIWMIFLGMLGLSALTSLSGCTRRFYRWRADSEVDQILAQKDKYPQWKLDDYYVYPHPLSRFADPTDWDRPPMPPDDPAAWDMSPHPQRPVLRGHQYWEGTGYLDLMRKWDAENRAKIDAEAAARKVEEIGEEPLLPGELKTFAQRGAEIDANIAIELAPPIRGNRELPIDLAIAEAQVGQCKPFLLNLEQVVQLGFLNSRDFQQLREELYLTALLVTAERFAFIAQPFVTEQVIRERSGARSVDGFSNRWLANTTAGFTKLFSTGALLLFNFANQTVYNLGSGPLKTTSQSTISLDLIQPFLAGGGRAVALEPLTQAERDLVYAIRQFYRFRQEYYVFFAAGQNTGFIPGVGAGVVALLPGTVQAPGAFVPGPFTLPLVANPATVQVSPQTALGPVLNSGVFITPQGYLSSVLERSQLFNYYKNIQAYQRFLRLYEVFLEGNLVTLVQKGQIEQNLLSNYETVLGQQLNFRVSLDQLKQQLGLPITVPIDIAPGPLQPMITLIEGYEKLSIDNERVIYNALNYGRQFAPNQIRQQFRQLMDRTSLMRGTRTRERTMARLPYWENLGRGMNVAARIKLLHDRYVALEGELGVIRKKKAKNPDLPLQPADERRQEELLFDYDMARYEYYLTIYENQLLPEGEQLAPWKTIKNEAVQREAASRAFRRVYAYLITMVDKAYVERQRGLKNLWPQLPPIRAEGIDVVAAPQDEALAAVERTTLNSRVDMMNVRAQLTDAWRKIRVAANALLGTFNVDYHLDSSTPAGQARPFAFGNSRTRHELIFTGQLPLVRILQRNNYRSTLINFQQTRRSLMAFEDQLLFNVRFDLRTMRIMANNYNRIQKRQIELAYIQVDQALQAFNQPQAPPQPGSEIQGLIGPVGGRPQIGDPAALTQQLLNVQRSLVGSQNDLYSIWVQYTIARINLYRDMGVMRLDSRGVWIDDDATSTSNASGQPAAGQPPAGASEQLPPPRPEPGPERLPPPRADAPAASAALGPRR